MRARGGKTERKKRKKLKRDDADLAMEDTNAIAFTNSMRKVKSCVQLLSASVWSSSGRIYAWKPTSARRIAKGVQKIREEERADCKADRESTSSLELQIVAVDAKTAVQRFAFVQCLRSVSVP